MAFVAQHHTSYQALMTLDSLSQITDLDVTATIYSSNTGSPLAVLLSLCLVLIEYFMYPS